MVVDVDWAPLDYDDDHIEQISDILVVKIDVITLLKANVFQIDELAVHVKLLITDYDTL